MGDADDSDRRLIARLAAGRDAQALAEVARRHGALVHGVCRRRAGATRATELVPAVFAALQTRAATVTGALPLWLHAEALARSAPGGAPPPGGEPEWATLAPAIDVAIGALAPLDRLLLLHAHARQPARGHETAMRADLDTALADGLEKAHGALAIRLALGVQSVPAARLPGLLTRNLGDPPPPAVAGAVAALALRTLEPAPAVAGPRRRIPVAYAIAIIGLIYVVVIAVAVWVLGPRAAARAQQAPAESPAR